jgi:hypothetical protein
MTRAELCTHLSWDPESLSSVLTRLKKETPKHPKRIHISGWVYDHEGARQYPRAQYALGDLPDKEHKRRVSLRQIHRNNEAARVNRMRTASVFHLGMTRDQLRDHARMVRQLTLATDTST